MTEAREATTLVLGGGGVWGVAWMTGLIKGLADAGVDLRQAAAMIGTSAGSVVACQLAGGSSIETLFQRQVDPGLQPNEPRVPPNALDGFMGVMLRQWSDPAERTREICRLALAADTITPAERKAVIVERLGLPSMAWPAKPLAITAVDAETAELRTFEAGDGVDLADAVAASCAVPGVWPPIPIHGRRYVDGGVWRTSENAHLAQGAPSVLIVSPMGRAAGEPAPDSVLSQDIARLRSQGAKVVLIAADAGSIATMAPGVLDPATRKPAAEAGRSQAARELAELRKIPGLRSAPAP